MHSITRRAWTKDEDTKLLDLVAKGTKHTVIANELGRPDKSISSRIRLLEKCQELEADDGEELDAASPKYPHRKQRNCLCCSKPFLSDGPHNRLCNRCRNKRADCNRFTPLS